jgi:hypothetical protein
MVKQRKEVQVDNSHVKANIISRDLNGTAPFPGLIFVARRKNRMRTWNRPKCGQAGWQTRPFLMCLNIDFVLLLRAAPRVHVLQLCKRKWPVWNYPERKR